MMYTEAIFVVCHSYMLELPLFIEGRWNKSLERVVARPRWEDINSLKYLITNFEFI